MAETKDVVSFLMDSLAEERRLYEQAKRDILEATGREGAHATNIFSIEGTLEFVTKGSPNPYHRQQPSVVQFPGVQLEFRAAKKPTPLPEPTFRSVITDVVKKHPGLRPREVWENIPEDAPLKLTLQQVQRTLGKLHDAGKIDREGGKYYPLEESIKESEATG